MYPYIQLCEDEVLKAEEIPWAQRSDTAFWRGSSTVYGTLRRALLSTNHRLRLVRALWGVPGFDVGLTSESQFLPPNPERPGESRRDALERYITAPLPLEGWSRHKYVLSISGNSYAGRDAMLCQLNSTLISVNMFDDMLLRALRNGTHYLRMHMSGEGLPAAVAWLRANDGAAEAMGRALRERYFSALRREGMLRIAAATLHLLSRSTTFVDD